jgi:hypothetical protein
MVKIISFGPDEGDRKPFHNIRNLYHLQMIVHPEDDIKKIFNVLSSAVQIFEHPFTSITSTITASKFLSTFSN